MGLFRSLFYRFRRGLYATAFGFGLLALVSTPARAQNVVGTATVGNNPNAVAVNPVTNKIYVANNGGTTVTVIDGATNGTTNVNVGSQPIAVAVNPVTNMIYVANHGSNTVTVGS